MLSGKGLTGVVWADLSWRARASYVAHAFKAVARQHHTELTPVMAPYIPRDAVIADVGGHSGQFAKLFAAMAPAGRVYSFEPGAYPRSILAVATRLRRPNNITVVPKGLGDKPSVLELSTPVKIRGSLRFGLAHMGSAKAGTGDRAGESMQSETVEVITLDNFANDVGLTRLDFLKADIEGWEQRMLVGGKATITKFRPVILIELANDHLVRAGDTMESAWGLLSSWGYTANRWTGTEKLEPQTEPWEGDTLWLPPTG